MAWRKVTGVLAAAAAAGLMFLALPASPAAAADTPLTLHNGPGSTAASFGTHDCTGPFANLPAGIDGFHFVWAQGGDFTGVSLNFNAGANVISMTPPSGSSGGASWLFASAGGKLKQLYVFVPHGWTLTDGTATGTGGGGSGPEATQFNLSHTCDGVPCPAAGPGIADVCSPPPCGPNSTDPNCQPPPCELPNLIDDQGDCVPPCPTNADIPSTSDDCTPPPCDEGFHHNSDGTCVPNDPCATATVGVPDVAAAVAPTCTTTSVSPSPMPPTGNHVSGVLGAAGVLILGGVAALFFARRRRSNNEGSGTPA